MPVRRRMDGRLVMLCHNQMRKLCIHAEATLAVVPGVPPISVEGTKFESASKNDLVDVYKLYMRTKMADAGNALPPLLDADFAEIREMLRLPEQCAPSSPLKLTPPTSSDALRI